MNNIYMDSTFFPTHSQRDERSTIKKVSFSRLQGDNTDVNSATSIFNLPQENIERMEQQLNEEKKKKE